MVIVNCGEEEMSCVKVKCERDGGRNVMGGCGGIWEWIIEGVDYYNDRWK